MEDELGNWYYKHRKGISWLMAAIVAVPLATTQCNIETIDNGKASKVGLVVKEENNRHKNDCKSDLEKWAELERRQIELSKHEEYSFERFKKALGPRYNRSCNWNELLPHSKRLYCLIYENPQQIISELEENEREEYKNFNPAELSEETLIEYEKDIPWNLIPLYRTPTESDKLMIFVINELRGDK